MKKILLFSSVLLSFIITNAQTFVSTQPSNKNVLLEEYTGIGCQYCPIGHKLANKIATDHPDRVVVINIHQGTYAINRTPNYTTPWGDELVAQTGLKGYPAATVNRHVFSGNMAMNLTGTLWEDASKQVLAENSCVNLAAKSTIDWGKRELKVTIEAYYTANSNFSENMLNIALLQDNIFGPQTSGSTYYPEMMENGLYRHNHMLRDLITEQLGDTIKETTQGSFFTKEYTYSIPTHINDIPIHMDDLLVVAFIVEGKKEVLTSATSELTYIYQDTPDVRVSKVKQVHTTSCDGSTQARVFIKNISNSTITSCKLKYIVNSVTNTDSIFTATNLNILPFAEDSILLPEFLTKPNNKRALTVTALEANSSVLTESVEKYATTTLSKDIIESNGNWLKLFLLQDKKGSEITWKISDANGNIIASGGPYQNLESGTLEHNIGFQPTTTGCYRFDIYDSAGNGINGGYYELYCFDKIIYSGSGSFGFGETKFINISKIGISETSAHSISNMVIYPNPAKNNISLDINLTEATMLNVSILDLLGREVLTTKNLFYEAGKNTLDINTTTLTNGNYILKVKTLNGVKSEKILIQK